MSFCSRGIKNIIRKPLKSILLIMLIIIISIFVFVGISSKDASVQVQTESKQAMGSGFQITENIENMRERLNKEAVYTYLPDGAILSQAPNHQFDSVLMEDILKIAQVEGIINYNVITDNTAVMQKDFERIYDDEKDQYADFGGVNLVGNLRMEENYIVKSGYMELTEGRYINENDKDVVVISEELAKLNNLKIGDKMTFGSIENKENSIYSATIVGIFKINNEFPTIYMGDTFRSENTIFTDLRFPEKPEGYIDDPLYLYATFQIEDLNKYDEILEKVKQLNIVWERYDIIDSNGVSETLASNFKDVSNITDIMLKTIFICSFAILFLMFIFWVRNRNYEIGIYLSLGKKKIEIVGQIIFEVVVITLVALSIGNCIAPKIASKISTSIVLSQIEDTNMNDDVRCCK